MTSCVCGFSDPKCFDPAKMTQKRVSWRTSALFPCFVAWVVFPVADTNVPGSVINPKRDAAVVLNPYVSVEDYQLLRQYPIPDLLPLIRLVGSEFKTVVIPILDTNPDHAVSLYLLPLAVAKYNEEITPTQNTPEIDVWLYTNLSHHNTSGANATIDDFTFLRLLADSTDDIHLETITTVTIFLNLTVLSLESLNDTFFQLRHLFPRPSWNIGISFELEEFAQAVINNSPFLPETLHSLAPFLDHVVFDFAEINNGLFSNQSVKSVLTQNLELAKSCRQFVQGIIKRPLSFVVKVGWPDTSPGGITNYTRAVEFWEMMANLAKGENLSVIFTNAFDQCYGSDPRETTSGWWRLTENSSYTNPSDYLFETKKEVALREAGRTRDSWIARINKTVKFDKMRVSAKFNPYVLQSYADNPNYFDRCLIPVLINKIAQHFQTLFVAHYELDSHDGFERATIPEAVAKFNLNTTSPLRLMMSVDLSLRMETRAIINLILRANDIFPGTVTKVMIFGEFSNSSIADLRKILNPEGAPTVILVGLYLPMEVCSGWGSAFLLPSTVPTKEILSWADFVYFSYLPGEEGRPSYVYGVERVLAQVKTWFESCKRRMAYNIPHLEVGFETGYADSIKSVEDDYLSGAIFWGEMNDWAKKTNTNIALSGAFDLPFRGKEVQLYAHLGWWKVLQDPEDQSKLIFLEKRLVALKKLQDARPEVVPEKSVLSGLVGTLVLALFVFLTMLIAYLCLKKRFPMTPDIMVCDLISYTELVELQSEDYITTLTPADFRPELSALLSTGNYGLIYRCFMVLFETEVMVKSVRKSDNASGGIPPASLKNLCAEIKIMRHVGHHENILQLLGVCRQGTPYMVTEYCGNGSLLSYLESSVVQDNVPSNSELVQYCREISRGMAFLTNRDVVHGDLSARNVLLNGTKTCKISNFGLYRKLDKFELYRKKDDTLPWRWMAYESLTNSDFSLKSDVWSLGVTFWEVFTLGGLPFPEWAWNASFCDQLLEGLRLEKPTRAEESLYTIMKSCWTIESRGRPSAVYIKHLLENLQS